MDEARRLVGEALDITGSPSEPMLEFVVSAANPAATQVIRYVRDGCGIASALMTPEGVNQGNRVTIEMISHYEDAAMLQAVVDAVVRGELVFLW